MATKYANDMTAIFSLTSDLHTELQLSMENEPFITGLQDTFGEPFIFCGQDFTSYGTHEHDIIYVRTGGTEGLFKELGLKGHILLLTSGQSNSLAASMEILSYLRQNGQSGEILHGSAEYICERIRDGHRNDRNDGHRNDLKDGQGNSLNDGQGNSRDDRQNNAGQTAPDWISPLPPLDLSGKRLGVIGHPSDWLISSGVDYSDARTIFGLELIDIPIEELISRVNASGCELRSFKGSEAVYDALKEMVAKYAINGLTIRCFDLLDTIHNTGCLALARLNSEGIPSSCEGDIPALISMMAAMKLTGIPGFQCNLSRIEGDNLLFAHCTVPLNMLTSYRYATHFESGIGTAIKGELPLGPVTVFKISPDLQRMVAIPGEIIENRSEPCLCRTQIMVHIPKGKEYFLTAPLANHHIIVPGKLF